MSAVGGPVLVALATALGLWALLFSGVGAAIAAFARRPMEAGPGIAPLTTTTSPSAPTQRELSILSLLDARFAHGEINADELTARRALLLHQP